MTTQVNGHVDANQNHEGETTYASETSIERLKRRADEITTLRNQLANAEEAFQYDMAAADADLARIRAMGVVSTPKKSAKSAKAATKTSKPRKPRAAAAPKDDPNADAVLEHLDRDGVKMADLVEKTKLSSQTIAKALKALIASGKAKKDGEARGTKYAAV